MSYVHTRRRGMGAASPSIQVSPITGLTVDCSQPLAYALSPDVCWSNTLGAWQQMNAIATATGPFPLLPVPTAPTGADYTAVTTGTYDPAAADQVTTDTLASGWQAWQQELQDYFAGAAASLPNVPDPQSTDYWMWAALLLGGTIALLALGKAL